MEEELAEGMEWRKAGGKQTYKFPEDVQSKPDPRCQHCEKVAYKAEVVTYDRIPYHKNCFRCLQCKKRMNPGEANPLGESTFVCNVHFQQISMGTSAGKDTVSAASANVKATGPSLVTGATAAEVDLSEGAAWRAAGNKQVYRYPEDIAGPEARADPRCQKCGKTTYKAETVTYEKIPFHKNCFKCLSCKKKLVPGGANPFGEDDFLCSPHYKQAVKRGVRSNSDVVSASSATPKLSGPSLVTSDGKEQDVDMTAGFAWRKAGVKQSYNYPEDVDGPTARADPRCQTCGKTTYKAELVTYERIPYHKQCFKCVQCRKKLTPGEANPFGEAEFLCNPHFKQVVRGSAMGAVGDVFSASTPTGKATGPSLVVGKGVEKVDLSEGRAWRKSGVRQAYKYPEDMEGPSARADPRCNKCGKTTYKAETITYERIPYHKNCFKCVQCKRRLTAGDANPFGPDGYMCNVHFHQVVFGGSGVDSDDVFSASSKEAVETGPSLVTAATSGGVNPKIQEGMVWRAAGVKQAYKYLEDMDGGRADPRCNLCGKTAYKAEVVTYERIPYHKNCFKCVQCKKRLNAGGANPFGEDSYLCNAHFMQFALRGGGLTADENAAEVASASSAPVDVSGPSVIGATLPKKKKTTYKPPKRRGK